MADRIFAIPPSFFSADGERLTWRAYVFLVLLCLASFTPGFATLPPTDRDESLFAQASKQMVESGNVVDIRVQDQPRYKKPVGIYWLQAASARLLTPDHLNSIWAYRVPSLVSAIITVTVTAALGTLLFSPMEGLLAAVMLSGCLLLNVEARTAKTDAALLASVVVAQYGLARAYINYGTRKLGWGVVLAFWSALAAGTLIKGINLLIVASTLLWLWRSEKQLRWLLALKPLFGIPYFLLAVAPWFVVIMLQSHGQFIQQSAGHDMLGKLWQDQGRGFIPPGAYLLAFPVTFFPFSLWGMLAGPDTWRDRKMPSVRFCLGWLVLPWIMFELVLAKLPHYVLPLYPAIALLAAKALLDGFPALAERRYRWLPPLYIGLWMLVGTGLALAATLIPYFLDKTIETTQIVAGVILLIGQSASLMLFFRQREDSVFVMAAGMLVFTISLFATNLPNVQHLWLSREIVATARSIHSCDDKMRIASTYNEPSLVFLAGTNTILRNQGEAVAAEMRNDPCLVGVIENDKRAEFLKGFAGFPAQPHELTGLRSFVVPRGRMEEVTLYILPQKAGTP